MPELEHARALRCVSIMVIEMKHFSLFHCAQNAFYLLEHQRFVLMQITENNHNHSIV